VSASVAHDHSSHSHEPHAHAHGDHAGHDAHPSQSIFDKLGIGVSLTCAVHCVITALLSLLPTMGLGSLGPTMEWLELPLLFGALCVGLFALLPTYFREHKKPLPLGLFSIGIAFIVSSRFVGEITETGLTVIGIAFVATAHVVNLKLHAAHHAKA
jgi:hypothetical protein